MNSLNTTQLLRPLSIVLACLMMAVGFSVIFLHYQLVAQTQAIDSKWQEVDQAYYQKVILIEPLVELLESPLGRPEREILANLQTATKNYNTVKHTDERVLAAGFIESGLDRLETTLVDYPQAQTDRVIELMAEIYQQQLVIDPLMTDYNQLVADYNQKLITPPYQQIASLSQLPPASEFNLTSPTPSIPITLDPELEAAKEQVAQFEFIEPPYQGPVNDTADILPGEFEQMLNEQLVASSRLGNTAQVVILTVPSLQDMPVLSVAEYMLEYWNIGDNFDDKGVLFLISVNDQTIMIAPTPALNEVLAPDRITAIINEQIAPAFESQKHLQGIQAGLNSVLLLIEDDASVNLPIPQQPTTTSFDKLLTPFLTLALAYLMAVTGSFYLIYLAALTKPWWVSLGLALVLGFVLGRFHRVEILIAPLFAGLALALYFGLKQRS